MTTMSAWVLRGHGDAALEDVPVPEPGPGEVRIRVHAAALNRHDVLSRQGITGPGIRERRYPHVCGSDGAGVVDRLGEGAGGVSVGDTVAVYPGIGCGACDWCRAGREPLCRGYGSWSEGPWGSLADYAIAPARNLRVLPPETDLVNVAAGTVAFTTAWHLLVTLGRVRVGEAVLVVGAGGGVALAALTLAMRAGASVYATSGQDWKVARVEELGAAAANHHAVAYDEWIHQRTGGRGADVVFDSNGAATWRRSIRSLAPGGRMLVCGATTGDVPEISIRELYQKQGQILGSPIGGRAGRQFGKVVLRTDAG
jgi:NADPH:quinone reductase-like Zn-dependent oxidoreductase